MLTLAFAGLLLAAPPARPLLVTVDDLPIASSLHATPPSAAASPRGSSPLSRSTASRPWASSRGAT